MVQIYQSTRDYNNRVTASQAILQGLAADGGLFTPVALPNLALDFEQLQTASYQEVAHLILSAFFDDFTEAEIADCIAKAYDEKFDTPNIAPVVRVGDVYHLELFHGATIAFKDMALSILPHLLTTSAKKQGVKDKIVILTATSGDTGKAAMAGFADVPGTEIIVFYPKGGVSRIQELQMLTQTGENTHVVGIEGNFDDAQTQVKKMFNDEDLRHRLAQKAIRFSSANSMNIGRLVPQIVYYIYAYAQMLKQGVIANGEKINVSVPTGNFGNILAAYYAKALGLPINRLICASNENKVLTDFFETSTYDKNRLFQLTSSPSMDILVSSNLERLVFHSLGNDAEATKALMTQLAEEGYYTLPASAREHLADFIAGFATEEETSADISRLYRENGYVEDPHTAVASSVYRAYQETSQDTTKALIVSTASPYKFPRVVVEAVKEETVEDDFDAVHALHQLSEVSIPTAVANLQESPVYHDKVVAVSDMQTAVESYLGLDKE